jgi:hypothetical protein
MQVPKRSKKSKKRRKPKPSTVPKRKAVQGERLNALVRGALTDWQKHEKMLKCIEAGASVDPEYAALRLVESADWKWRKCAQYVRLRFGTELRATEGDELALITEISGGKLRIVGHGGYQPVAALVTVRPERRPRNLREVAQFEDLVTEYTLAAFSARAMIGVGRGCMGGRLQS